jgi:hypothetical protein
MTIKRFLATVVTAAAISGSAPAWADLALMLTAGAPLPFPGFAGPSVTIFDQVFAPPPGNAADLNPAAGAVTFVGPLGAWNINITTGLGSVVLGGPAMDLSSVNVSTIGSLVPPAPPVGGAGTSLEIKLSENNLNIGAAMQVLNFLGSIGGTADGRISWSMYVDDSNALFGLSQLIGMGTFTGANDAPFSDLLNTMRAVSDTFSMTLRVVIEHGDGIANTSFNFSGAALRGVPEPGTLLVLGAGMLLLAFVRLRQRG